MASATKAPASPQADVFLPSTASGGGTVGGGKILGMDRKTAMIVGVVALALVAYLVYRHYENSSSSSASTDTSGDNIDPATGYPYGSAADLAALGAGPSGSSAGSGGDTTTPTTTETGGSNQGTSDPTADLAALLAVLYPSGLSTNGNQGTNTKTPTTTTNTKTQTVDHTSKSNQVGGGSQISIPANIGGSYNYGASSVQSDIYGGLAPPVAVGTPAPATPTSPYTVASTGSSAKSSPVNPTGLSANKKQGVFSTH